MNHSSHYIVCAVMVLVSVFTMYSCKEDAGLEIQYIESFYEALSKSHNNGTVEQVLRANCNNDVLRILMNYYDDDCDHDDCFADWLFEDSPAHHKEELLQRSIKQIGDKEYQVENKYHSHSHIISMKLEKQNSHYLICDLKVVEE